ncbi:MAG: hypothetical protein ACW98W_14960, partial [Candidatus Hodarchaeales archaeon]
MIGFNFFAQNIPPELYLLAFGVLIIVGFLIVYFRRQIADTLGIGAAKKTILEQEIEQRLVQIRQLYRQENFKAAAV